MFLVKPVFLYIDPGTGSMLFSIFIGIVTTLVFVVKKQWIRLKFRFSGGKAVTQDNNKIPYVIFTDSKRYWNVFKPICDEFERRGLECVYYTASEDDPALSVPYKYVKAVFIGEGNRAFAKLNMMKAGVCLSTTPGLDVLQWKRSKDVDYYVHTYHAVDEGTRYRMFGLDYYDAVLLTGDFQERYIRMLEQKRDLPRKETCTVGCTYLDDMKLRLDDTYRDNASENHTKTVLLAPSWGPSSILNKYGEEIIKALVETGNNIVIRPHPQTAISDSKLLEDLMNRFPNDDRLSWNFDNDNFDVLMRSDIMITDFSGIIFDYALVFDRPLIYADTNLDLAPYDAAWIDEPLWLYGALEKLGKRLDENDFPEFGQVIDEVVCSDAYAKGREEIRNVTWQCRGEAAKKTVDYLVSKYADIQSAD